MPSERINLRDESCNIEDALRRGVDLLQDGRAVVLPTETVYGLAATASHPAGVARLLDIKGRDPDKPLSLALTGLEMLYEFLPEPEPLALRLARRCWPGPVTLVLPVEETADGVVSLPGTVREVVLRDGQIGFRVPHHPITQTILGELNEPVVLTSANRSGEPEPEDAEAVLRSLDGVVDLVLDDGPAAVRAPSTVVRVRGDSCTILREGAVKRETLKRLTAKIVLFVCTGNTCRSPMAEVICEKLLADRLGCRPDELEDHGLVVMSAGVAAGANQAASSHAETTVQEMGLSLRDHVSQQLNANHVRFADHIFALGRGHREAILSYWPDADTRLSVLRTDGGDISDPFGGSRDEYRQCAEMIEAELKKRLDEILA